MTKQKVGECVYCGKVGPITDDHIPPKTLFSKPRPTDLIYVPSCGPCNNGASDDDEYFKTMLVLKDKAGSHPAALSIRPSVIRALQKPRKKRFAEALARNTNLVSLSTPAGLYLGRRPTMNVDLERLDRVVARITRGLYYHHLGCRIPVTSTVRAMSEQGFAHLTSAETKEIQETVVWPTLRQPSVTIGSAVMRYWVAWGTVPEQVSSWVFEFFGDVRFAAAVLPVNRSA